MGKKAPSYSGDFFSDEVILNPYPVYRDMRAIAPVLWLEKHNAYAAVSHRAVVDVLRRPKTFLSGRGLSLNDDVNKLLIGNTLNADGERHSRQRAITATAIMPNALTDLHPFIKDAAMRLAAHLDSKKSFDAVTDFAQILPVSIVIELVGLPESGRRKMLEWADAAFNLFEGFNERSQASFAKLQDLRNFLEEHGNPEALAKGGLTSRIFEEAPKHGFSMDEAAQLMRDYINPSLDTTISAASFLVYYFARHPDQWDCLRERPELAENAIEEVVRLTTPIRCFSRYVDDDCTVEGYHIEKGARILAVYASANRDESVFENPDDFNITRKTTKHVGFGFGKHTCMGMHLARLELLALLHAFLPRVSRWHCEGVPEIARNNTIRGLTSLPVRIENV